VSLALQNQVVKQAGTFVTNPFPESPRFWDRSTIGAAEKRRWGDVRQVPLNSAPGSVTFKGREVRQGRPPLPRTVRFDACRHLGFLDSVFLQRDPRWEHSKRWGPALPRVSFRHDVDWRRCRRRWNRLSNPSLKGKGRGRGYPFPAESPQESRASCAPTLVNPACIIHTGFTLHLRSAGELGVRCDKYGVWD